jgi:hypothetical protein
MVHRIMADFMSPARVVPKTYDAHVARGAAFKLISSQDKGLGAETRALVPISAAFKRCSLPRTLTSPRAWWTIR